MTPTIASVETLAIPMRLSWWIPRLRNDTFAAGRWRSRTWVLSYTVKSQDICECADLLSGGTESRGLDMTSVSFGNSGSCAYATRFSNNLGSAQFLEPLHIPTRDDLVALEYPQKIMGRVVAAEPLPPTFDGYGLGVRGGEAAGDGRVVDADDGRPVSWANRIMVRRECGRIFRYEDVFTPTFLRMKDSCSWLSFGSTAFRYARSIRPGAAGWSVA